MRVGLCPQLDPDLWVWTLWWGLAMITGPFPFAQPLWGGSWGALDPWDCVCGVAATHAVDGQHHRATELCAGEGARDGEGGRPGRWAPTQAHICPNPQPFPAPGDLGFCLATSGSPSHSYACLQTHNSAMTWNYVMRQWSSWMRSSCVPSSSLSTTSPRYASCLAWHHFLFELYHIVLMSLPIWPKKISCFSDITSHVTTGHPPTLLFWDCFLFEISSLPAFLTSCPCNCPL